MIKFDVLSRFTGEVKFTAEIDCTEDAPHSLKIGLAAKWGVKNSADFSYADLRNADLRNADLSYADLSYAELGNADLRSANLSYADLSYANLSYAELGNANLRNANLRNADFSYASPWDANLRNADLSYAELGNADLRNADLSYANLRNANLWDADLRNANLSYANLRNADLSYADLGDATGLNDFVKCIQIETYSICYTSEVMQVGCEHHQIAEWRDFDDKRIARMDGKTALKFWRKYKDWIFQTIELCPAKPTKSDDQ